MRTGAAKALGFFAAALDASLVRVRITWRGRDATARSQDTEAEQGKQSAFCNHAFSPTVSRNAHAGNVNDRPRVHNWRECRIPVRPTIDFSDKVM